MPASDQVAKKPAASMESFRKQRAVAAVQIGKKPVVAEATGSDSNGGKYQNIQEMWSAELKDEKTRRDWYAVAETYWEGQEASITGVLGGYSYTHGPDITDSKRFIKVLQQDGLLATLPDAAADRPGKSDMRCVDVGAGIGRVASALLLDAFGKVDIVEPNKRLLEKARKDLASDPRAGKFIRAPLQKLKLPVDTYDIIWAQWVLMYLPDKELVDVLKLCATSLHTGGFICIKENVVLRGKWLLDKEDNSMTRTDEQYRDLFEEAGLEMVYALRQTSWPRNLMPVMMYALRPVTASRGNRAPAVKKRPAGFVKVPRAKARTLVSHT